VENPRELNILKVLGGLNFKSVDIIKTCKNLEINVNNIYHLAFAKGWVINNATVLTRMNEQDKISESIAKDIETLKSDVTTQITDYSLIYTRHIYQDKNRNNVKS
jgi:hypothetical protein